MVSAGNQEKGETADILHHKIPTFNFVNGTTLENVTVAYRSINPESKNGVVLIPTCFSGRINTTLTFTEPPLNSLSDFHVIVAAMLGNGESSSPSNTPEFPQPGHLYYEDIIHAHHHLLTQGLGVFNLQAVVGFSMGGQQAYHWAVMYPSFVTSIVGICTSARTSPHNYTFLEGPITALENSIDYVAWKSRKVQESSFSTATANTTTTLTEPKLGHPRSAPDPVRGLTAFRRAYAAWLTSAEWFRAQSWRHLGSSSLTDWLQSSSESSLDWDADDLLILARTWQMGDIGKVAAGQINSVPWTNDTDTDTDNDDIDTDLIRALTGIQCPVLLMPCRSDQYFRPSENDFEMKHLKQATLRVIESDWGHIAGGGACVADAEFMDLELKNFLQMV